MWSRRESTTDCNQVLLSRLTAHEVILILFFFVRECDHIWSDIDDSQRSRPPTLKEKAFFPLDSHRSHTTHTQCAPNWRNHLWKKRIIVSKKFLAWEVDDVSYDQQLCSVVFERDIAGRFFHKFWKNLRMSIYGNRQAAFFQKTSVDW
jgi:hypothetical protein